MEKNIMENQNCHDELLAQLSENCDNVEELALSEINNLEFVMSPCHSLGSLSRYQFSLFLRRVKKIRDSAQILATLTAICVDSLTCMIKSSSFYVSYMDDNKMNLNLLLEMMGVAYMLVATNSQYFPSESLSAFIAILERSATRIQFTEIAVFDQFAMYIRRLKAIKKFCINNSNFKKQVTNDSNFESTEPVAGVSASSLRRITPVASVSASSLRRIITPVAGVSASSLRRITSVGVSIKSFDDCTKGLNSAQVLVRPEKHSDTCHIIDVGNETGFNNRFGYTKRYIMKESATNQVMQENKSVPRLLIKKDTFEPKKQLLCTKRPSDDTDCNNEKENVQPPTKVLKLESTHNVSPCFVKIENNNAFEVLMSRSVLKKK